MRIVLAVVAALVLANCAEPREQAQAPQSEPAGCLVDLTFTSDAQRTAFLHDNAPVIVDVISTGAALLASHPHSPEIKLFSTSSCADFEASHLGLAIPESAFAGTADMTLAEVSQNIGSFANSVPFDQRTQTQCIVRISPVGSEHSAAIMNVLASSGLRTHMAAGSDNALFGAYAEPCELVRSHVDLAVSQAGVAWPAPIYCANLSLAQCGFSGNVSAGRPD